MTSRKLSRPKCLGCGAPAWISLSMFGWICQACYAARAMNQKQRGDHG